MSKTDNINQDNQLEDKTLAHIPTDTEINEFLDYMYGDKIFCKSTKVVNYWKNAYIKVLNNKKVFNWPSFFFGGLWLIRKRCYIETIFLYCAYVIFFAAMFLVTLFDKSPLAILILSAVSVLFVLFKVSTGFLLPKFLIKRYIKDRAKLKDTQNYVLKRGENNIFLILLLQLPPLSSFYFFIPGVIILIILHFCRFQKVNLQK